MVRLGGCHSGLPAGRRYLGATRPSPWSCPAATRCGQEVQAACLQRARDSRVVGLSPGQNNWHAVAGFLAPDPGPARPFLAGHWLCPAGWGRGAALQPPHCWRTIHPRIGAQAWRLPRSPGPLAGPARFTV